MIRDDKDITMMHIEDALSDELFEEIRQNLRDTTKVLNQIIQRRKGTDKCVKKSSKSSVNYGKS